MRERVQGFKCLPCMQLTHLIHSATSSPPALSGTTPKHRTRSKQNLCALMRWPQFAYIDIFKDLPALLTPVTSTNVSVDSYLLFVIAFTIGQKLPVEVRKDITGHSHTRMHPTSLFRVILPLSCFSRLARSTLKPVSHRLCSPFLNQPTGSGARLASPPDLGWGTTRKDFLARNSSSSPYF